MYIPNLPSDNVEGVYYVCDGTADDVQINAAIAAVVALGGGKVTLSAGTFYISASLVLGDQVTPYSDPMVLEGQGDATILYAVNGLNASVIRTASAVLGSSIDLRHTIRDLKIDGNSATDGGQRDRLLCVSRVDRQRDCLRLQRLRH